MSIVDIESLAILLLVVISIVALVVSRLRIPYTVALVLVGLAITFQQVLKADVTPNLILALFIPPVAFEAAFHIEWRTLRENMALVLMLAVFGVVVSTVISGGAVALLLPGIPLVSAVVFGAVISATDPVAVVALFRSFSIPKRLSVLVEAESLLNDGTAIVVFNLALVVALTGVFQPLQGIVDFFRVAAGGAAIGGALGWIVARLITQIDDYLVETTLTTCLAFGSYLIAEHFQTSGVLAVVVAGLLCGTLGTQGMSATTRIVVSNFWEYLGFLANSMVFLLIGLTINVTQLVSYLGPIAAAIVAVLLSRAIVVYIPPLLFKRIRRELPQPWQHVLFWGGLRGAVSLALALSLPAALENRDTLRVMTFGVVLFTLIVQAPTMQALLKRLSLVGSSPRHLERDMRIGRIFAAQAAWRRLRELNHEGVLTGEVWNKLRTEHLDEQKRLDDEVQALFVEFAELEHDLILSARREAIQAERAALNTAFQRGLITDDAYGKLVAEVDQRIENLLTTPPNPK